MSVKRLLISLATVIFHVGGVRVRRGGLVGHTGFDRRLSGEVLLCGALSVCFVQCLRDQVQHEVSLGELFAGAECFALEVTFDALEEFFGDLECHRSAFFSHVNAAFLIFDHVVIVLDEVGDVLAGGLAQPFPFFADPLMQIKGDLSAQVFGGCHSRTPLSYFCNASIPERLRESYYQHHQGMIDKQGESNISTNVTEKAAVLSHMGSRTAACLLILHSFLASVFKSHQSARVLCCISEMSPLAWKN